MGRGKGTTHARQHMNISNDKYKRLRGQQKLGVRGANGSSMKGSRLQTSNIATILREKGKKRRRRHVHQDLVLELRVTDSAGYTLGHICETGRDFEKRDGKVKQHRKMWRKHDILYLTMGGDHHIDQPHLFVHS